jgi:hypothetical protein
MNDAAAFDRYVGIDYSGAQTPVSSLKARLERMAFPNAGGFTEREPLTPSAECGHQARERARQSFLRNGCGQRKRKDGPVGARIGLDRAG